MLQQAKDIGLLFAENHYQISYICIFITVTGSDKSIQRTGIMPPNVFTTFLAKHAKATYPHKTGAWRKHINKRKGQLNRFSSSQVYQTQ